MGRFKYVTVTWAVTQLVHPLCFSLFEGVGPDAWPAILFFGFLFSLPGYLLCVISLNLINMISTSETLKFCIWIVVLVCCITFGTYLGCGFLFDFDVSKEIIPLAAPATISAVIVVLVRHQSFFLVMQPTGEELPDK
jgi:hypothetical protein